MCLYYFGNVLLCEQAVQTRKRTVAVEPQVKSKHNTLTA